MGGVCAVALIAGLIWFLVRRRRSQNVNDEPSPEELKAAPPKPPSELHSKGSHFEAELPGKDSHFEVPGAGVQRAELS